MRSFGFWIVACFTFAPLARAAWSCRLMDFGLSDERMDAVREELIKYI